MRKFLRKLSRRQPSNNSCSVCGRPVPYCICGPDDD